MIAVDTNVLVYAHRADSPHHLAAARVLHDLAAGVATWSIPWPCVHEFLAVVTHRRIYQPPTETAIALDAVRSVAALPNLRLLHESEDHRELLARQLTRAGVVGPRVHDARIAAICLGNGVSELWSADRDFSWFPDVRVRNPLVG